MNEIDQDMMMLELVGHISRGKEMLAEKQARDQAEKEARERQEKAQYAQACEDALAIARAILPEYIHPFLVIEPYGNTKHPRNIAFELGSLRINVPGCALIVVFLKYDHATERLEVDYYSLPYVRKLSYSLPDLSWGENHDVNDLEMALASARNIQEELDQAIAEFNTSLTDAEVDETFGAPPVKYEPVVDDDPDPNGLINYEALAQFVQDAVDERLSDLGYMVVEDL